MRVLRRTTIVFLFSGLFLARPGTAQIHQCVAAFSTCATVLSVVFSGHQLQIRISNDVLPGGENENAFIGRVLLELNAPPPNLLTGFAYVQYQDNLGGAAAGSEYWKGAIASGQQGGFGTEWDLELTDNAPGGKKAPFKGDSGLRLGVGLTAIITLEFEEYVEELGLADCDGDCFGRQLTMHFQGLGWDGEQSGWSAVPEPMTVVLLASGLLGVGGVGLIRRRRGLPLEDR